MPDSSTKISELLATKPAPQLIRSQAPVASDQCDPTGDEFTTENQCRIARRPQMMICFRKCSGEVEVLPYSMLARIRSENPDQEFQFHFHGVKVTVEGENLLQLFHYACEHRLAEIGESDRSVAFRNGENEYCVTRILIEGRTCGPD